MMNSLLKMFADFVVVRGMADEAYIVGGAVRDILKGSYESGVMSYELKNVPRDIDIAVKGDAISIAKKFAGQTGSSFILLDSDFGIARVVKGEEYLDICAMRGETIYTDLAERDITINAMAIPLKNSYDSPIHPFTNSPGIMAIPLKSYDSPIHPFTYSPNIIDPYNGKSDLQNKIIRMVSEKNLVDDPLRLLRVYRFAAALDFHIEPDTLESVKRLAALVPTVAAERIAEELRHILKTDNSFKTVKAMADDGILHHIFPEMGKSLQQSAVRNQEKALLLYKHTEEALNNFSRIFQASASGPAAGTFSLQRFEEYFETDYRKICLKLSVVFEETEMAREAAAKLKMSARETEFIYKMALNRMKISRLFEQSRCIPDSIETIRFLKEFQDDLYPLVILAVAQTFSGQPSHPIISFCRDILVYYHKEFLPRLGLLPLITGDDLINEFRIKPSPIFKQILSQIDDMVLEGIIDSREEALKLVNEIINNKP